MIYDKFHFYWTFYTIYIVHINSTVLMGDTRHFKNAVFLANTPFLRKFSNILFKEECQVMQVFPKFINFSQKFCDAWIFFLFFLNTEHLNYFSAVMLEINFKTKHWFFTFKIYQILKTNINFQFVFFFFFK